MTKLPQILILVLSLLFFCNSYGQEQDKPKVALVLSGGGAKGLAHIPLLQALDSLGIVPDLVVGTSMGSIVGGLYAMGYSGDSIANIALSANWNSLLGGSVSLSDVGVEEKSEFKRYLFDLNLVNGKPIIDAAILNDQNLRELLSELTYPVYGIDNFDNLAIPYRAVATDVVNGKEVVLDRGSLAIAMRASMSIPSVFKPIEYKETLLVDGGILNNFPTDIAKQLNADIIIGSDVGGGMLPKEKLTDPITILLQTSMLMSNIRNDTNRAHCDILLDHIPNLTYSTGDFNNGPGIYDEGKLALQSNIDALTKLSERLKTYQQTKSQLPEVPQKIMLDTILYKNISNENIDLVKARIKLETGNEYSVAEINSGINRIRGTMLFDAIYFNPLFNENVKGIELEATERSRHSIKGAVHYDSHRGIGLIMNYTGRNLLGEASRSLITLDIAEQPQFRLQHQKIFGERRRWWWRSEILGQFLKENIFIEGKRADNINHTAIMFDNQFNKNLSDLKSYVGIGATYEYNNLNPQLDPDITNNIFGLERYSFHNIEVGVTFRSNSMQEVFFPRKGAIIETYLYRSILHHIDLDYSVEDFESTTGSTNGFTKFGGNFERRWRMNPNAVFFTSITGNFTLLDDIDGDQISFSDFGATSKFSLGGFNPSPKRGNLTFPGLYEGELFANQIIKAEVGLQLSPFRNFYISPHTYFASLGYEGLQEYFEDFSDQSTEWSLGVEPTLLWSLGSTFSYDSYVGPVHIDFSYVSGIEKFRVFFSVGIPLGRSF